MFTVRFVFSKTGIMKYISHLDLMRLFMRGFRRAGFPLKMSEGFSPHPKLSIKRALKLGLESENEEASVILKEQIDPQEFKERLQEQLPEGIIIREAFIQANTKYQSTKSKISTKHKYQNFCLVI
jgi:radical SAM-linked protein